MRHSLGILLLALAASPVAAQRSLAIKRFNAVIVVNHDASIDVTESITAQFTGAWNGIYRTIPVEYHTPQGFNWTLRVDLIGATGEGPEGKNLKVESRREGHYIKYKIWVPGAENSTHTVVLRYRARNGLRFFADHDELYWNITGDEWDVPIESATARIELPGAASGIRAIAFNGVYGSTARDAVVDPQGTTIRITMPKPLDFHEGVTAVVGWDKGVVTEPTATQKTFGFLASNWPLGIPVAVLLGMFTIWYRVGRDPTRLPIVVQYEPPASLTPAEAGTLIDGRADMRDITATMVDLAVRGYLKIEERDDSQLFGLLKRRAYVFHKLEPPAGAAALAPHEQGILDGVFSSGKIEVPLADLQNSFYKHIPGIRDSIFTRLIGRGLYRSRPDSVKGRWLGGAVALGFGMVALGGSVGPQLNLTLVPVFVAALLSALIMAAFGLIMPARTVAGARALEGVLGFEEFLKRVEGERFERIVKTPEMFEKFLAYAMAFQVEERWARAFRDIYREPPRWYVGGNPGSFNVGHFSNHLTDLSTRTASTMSSSPRSSGGSGFGGGGSSGGGGGGGGGGGF
jgi:Predicted membrane protein (DUF2207) C-terminal domain/Predicted membrane protein (DUF2207) N-terminal domain